MPADSSPDRPLILLSPWRRHLPTFLGERTELDTLHPPYGDLITVCGGLALVAPRPPEEHAGAVAEHLLDLADGLLLTGGGDIDPTLYGDPDRGALLVDPLADAWEVRLVRGAAARALPTLGICRGAQIMAVAFGGRLHQDLPPDSEHGDLLELSAEQALAERHWVDLVPGTATAKVLGATRIHVNTIHRHAVSDPGEFEVSGFAAGKLIEAIETTGRLAHWPALGVQWHPEKLAGDPGQRKLFDFIVETASAYRDARAPARALAG